MANDCPSRSSTSVSARRVDQRRNPEALERDAVGEVERADFGPDLEADHVAGDGRREVQPDAELLEHDGDRARDALDDRHRELAAGEEAGFLAVVGDQVRLGQALEVPVCWSALMTRADVVLAC